MAQPARPPIRFGSVRLMRDAPLGSGAYGQVYRATLDELQCAAKLLHAVLLDPDRPRNLTLFEQECRFLSEIRHPNIVQYLGVALDEESGLPILLMELMDDSLTHFLEQSGEPLAYHVQVNISHDIALAVAFLHLNRIVHRDLSSSNVLLIGAGSRAKVTDFGMSTLTELNPRMSGLTKCPGNPAYMSPEALLDPPVYTEKLDCFQVGVLMLQIMTRKYPVPGRAMNRVQVTDARFPTGWVNVPVPELQRRHDHLRLVLKTHPMLRLTKDCLKDTDTDRPSGQQICRRLSALKEAPQYAQSLEGRGGEREGGERVARGGRERGEREGEGQETEELIQQLREENQSRVREKDREVREKEREVGNLRGEVQEKEGENETLRGVVQEKEREVREKDREVREKEREVGNLRGEVQEKEGENETLRGVVQEKEREVREKEREVREKEREVGNLRGEVQEKERENETLRGVVQEKEREVREKEREVREKEREVREKEREVGNLRGEVQEKEGENETLRGVVQEKEMEVREKEREVREKEREVANLRGEVQEKEGENETFRGVVQEKEREVGNIRRDVRVKDGEIENLRHVVREREREVRVKSEENQHLRRFIQDKDQTIHQLQETQQFTSSYTCLVSGRGLQSATANHPTHVVVELSHSSGRPCSLKQNVTAELVMQSTSSQATPTNRPRQPSSSVAVTSPSRYEVSYTAVRRGPHKLHVRVNGSEINGSEINGSPFIVTVYPDPTQLHVGSPVRVVKQLNSPSSIAFNSRGEMIVSERDVNHVTMFDVRGRRIRSFGSSGNRLEQMIHPSGIAVDDTDNIYVTSEHKLQKFTSSGELIKCIGRRGSKEAEFRLPLGVTIHSNQIYVCDKDNHRIQVFDLDVNFIGSIGSRGSGRGEFELPYDVAFDTVRNMYVVEFSNDRVQVMDSSGQFIRMFGQEGKGKLSCPTALHIADKYVYVSNWSYDRIAVYETSGQNVTSFGRCGEGEGEFRSPCCITSCVSGCIYVCDRFNNRVQVF